MAAMSQALTDTEYDRIAGVLDRFRNERTMNLEMLVSAIYGYFASHRRLAGSAGREATTHRRSAPKVGRNDPCPCGSGQKFKKCCGKVTLH
jgi:uncharacterized protein YecA (UPF0149 family)